MKLLAALLLAFGLLAGCVQTRFESLPGNRVENCDTRWVGNWRLVLEDEDDDPGDTVHVSVSADCSGVRSFENGEVEDLSDITLRFARVGDLEILAVARVDDAPGATQPVEKERQRGYHYFRYRMKSDGISLHAVDDRHVARMLIDGKLGGSVEFVSQRAGGKRPRHGDSLDNFVAGDPAAMAKVVQMRGVFQRRSHLRLIRVDAIPTSSDSAPSGTSP